MLRFKVWLTESINLQEAKIDDYKDQETNISTEHDPNAIYKDPSDIIDHFHAHNPTGDVNHTKWVVNQYKKGNIKQEDAPAMGDLLTKFNKHKDKLPKKRIEQYKTHGELNSALENVAPSKKDIKSEKEQKTVAEGSTLVHSTPNMNLYHVHDTAASRVLGKGMPWCTSRMDDQNMFDHYNAQSNHRFYIGHMHNEKAPYRKLGIGVGTGEFQDENNEKIEGDRLKSLVARNPELKKIPHLQGVTVHTTDDHNKHIDDLIENDHEELTKDQHKNPGKYNDTSIKKLQNYNRQMTAAINGRAEDLEGEKLPNKVAQTLARNTTDKNALKDLSNHPHTSVRAEVAGNFNTNRDDVLKLAKDSDPYVRGSVAISRLKHEETSDVIKQETDPNVLHAHAWNLRDDDLSRHSRTFLSNKNTPDNVLAQITNHNTDISDEELLNHPNSGDKTLAEIVNKIKTRKNIESDYGSRPITKNYDGQMRSILTNPKLKDKIGPETLDSLEYNLPDHDTEAMHTIATHPKTGEYTLYRMAMQRDNPSKTQKAILGHNNVSDKVIREIASRSKNRDVDKMIAEHPKSDGEGLALTMYRNVHDPEILNLIGKHPNSDDMVPMIRAHLKKLLHSDKPVDPMNPGGN